MGLLIEVKKNREIIYTQALSAADMPELQISEFREVVRTNVIDSEMVPVIAPTTTISVPPSQPMSPYFVQSNRICVFWHRERNVFCSGLAINSYAGFPPTSSVWPSSEAVDARMEWNGLAWVRL